MSNLINRHDAIKEVHNIFTEEIFNTTCEVDEDGYDIYTDTKTVNLLLHCNKRVSQMLKALPSTTFTGKWLFIDDGYTEYWECDQCGKTMSTLRKPGNYCPECGAEMEREK